MNVKNILSSVKNKIIPNYLSSENKIERAKSTDINILLNRVRQDQKNESRKKITIFSSSFCRSLIIWCSDFLKFSSN